MPNDGFFKLANAGHQTLLRLSGGRLGSSLMNMPILELTTTGAKTGQKRTSVLTTPLSDGDSIVVVASRGGDPKNPAWLHNVKANPDVEVAFPGGKPKLMRARVATAEERARLWPKVVARYSGYGDYQKRATREIPLVLLDPVSRPERPRAGS
jgi:deazaflavin-dependent oxidoreductase (nitroreductase family)